MICKVKNTIEKYHMLDNVKSVAVGVSGGADSMCLVNILSKLKEEYGILIKVVHLNHGIRGEEAKRDELTVKRYCEKNEIEFISFYRDIPLLAKERNIGEEECGRQERYACFDLARCDAIATAHTLSDSIETMVFNLLRGTGTKGLCGIPPKREKNVIRPLIDCTREEIENYCLENNISYVTDSTNLENEYKRNFIRHNIVPLFSDVNSGYGANIASALDILRCENDYIHSCALSILSEAKLESGYSRKHFIMAHEAVRKRAVALILSDKMTKSIERRHIDLVDDLILNGKGKIELNKHLYIACENDIIYFQSPKEQVEDWECLLNEGDKFFTPYGTFHLCHGNRSDLYDKNAIDGDKLINVLKMTNRKQGDKFYCAKRKNTKSLKKLFCEDKIPIQDRNKIAILRCGDNLVWVDNYGTDGRFLPGDKTKNILIIKKEG